MTGSKMLEVLEFLTLHGVKLRGAWISSTTTGRLQIQTGSQPDKHVHKWLLQKAFRDNGNGDYVYDPRKS